MSAHVLLNLFNELLNKKSDYDDMMSWGKRRKM